MQGFHDHGQVVLPRERRVSRVARLERDPVGHSRVLGDGAGQRDRRFVQVEAIHSRRGVSARDGDGGPPHAARDVSDARAGLELLVHVGDEREVLGGERAHQPRPVEVALRLDRVGPLHGDALAGPVRIDELGEHAAKG